MVLAYDWDNLNSCVHFFTFCMLEMCVLEVRKSAFNVHFFKKFQKLNILNNKILVLSNFFLKVDFVFFLLGMEYLTFLRRIRYHEYLRAHTFFVKNFKIRKYFINYLYVVKAPRVLLVKKEIEWVKHSLYNLNYNFRLYSFYRKFSYMYIKFDLNVINLLKNNLNVL